MGKGGARPRIFKLARKARSRMSFRQRLKITVPDHLGYRRDRDRFRILAPPHQAGDLVGFVQAIHAAPQPVLRTVLAGTELFPASHADAAQWFSAELACSLAH
jgi:hypothetical protein